MAIEDEHSIGENSSSKEKFIVNLTEPMLYDRLHTLSVEYSVSDELLVNIAVKRLVDDIDFVRDLRAGKLHQSQLIIIIIIKV